MKRTDKIKVLQNALQGQTTPLQQMHHQYKAKAMPFQETYGIIDARQCSPMLLDLQVLDGEQIIDGTRNYQPLSRWLENCHVGPKSAYRSDNAYSSIDASHDAYDTVPVALIQLKRPNCLFSSLPGGTVADLRRWHSQCATSVLESFVVLVIETDLSYYSRRHETC